MGAIYLDGMTPGYPSLAAVIAGAGIGVEVAPGWERTARSSGGFDPPGPLTVVVHHTASPPGQSFANDWSYCQRADDGPIGNILLGRDGHCGLHAGGASNHAGKGGPWPTSRGTIPLDGCNSRSIGVEAQNAGTGAEPWPPAQVAAYLTLVAALVDAYGIAPLDVVAHYEWGGPNVPQPGRKIDPSSGALTTPGYAFAGPGSWVMRGGAGFCDQLDHPPPPPEDDDMAGYLYQDDRWQNVFLLGQGPATPVATAVLEVLSPRLGPTIKAAHDQTLSAICEQAWGVTVDEAVAQRLLV